MMMKFCKFVAILKQFFRWYREPIPGYHLLRVDPITVLTVIVIMGLVSTIGGVVGGLETKRQADKIADELRNAEEGIRNQIDEAYRSNNISGYDYEVAMERLNTMGPTLRQYADIIENKGNDIADDALIKGFWEAVVSLDVTTATFNRTFLSAKKYGQVIDELVQYAYMARTAKNLPNLYNPFFEEEQELRKRINEFLGGDPDDLFKARMRTKINLVKQKWLQSIKENPCPGNNENEEFRNWASEKVSIWAEQPVRLYGDGEKWATYDDFLEWMIIEAQGHGLIAIMRDYSGNFELDRSPTTGCKVCVPPWLSGEIKLSVDLVTCKVTGEIKGGGEGEGAKTDNCTHGLKNPCSGQGKIEFDGVIEGFADNAGVLNLDPTKIQVHGNITWRDGCDKAPGVYNLTWVDTLTISGTIDWKEYIQGEINYPVSGCGSVGNFTLLYQENPYGY
jgi:hypothetical protein